MGGSNQATMSPPPASSVATGKGATLRFHEGPNGNFHFHDDKAGVKVEVPQADFTSAMNGPNGLYEQAGDWSYTDPTTNLTLNIRTFMNNGEMEVETNISKPKKSANLEALMKLITG